MSQPSQALRIATVWRARVKGPKPEGGAERAPAERSGAALI
jgi:hypothetical protein